MGWVIYVIVAGLVVRRGWQKRFLALVISDSRTGQSDYDIHW